MKFYLYAFKNRLLGQYDRPVAEIVEPKDYATHISMALVAADPAALQITKEFDVYCIGEFDVKSGKVDVKDDFVCSLEPICLQIIEHKEKENGGKDDTKSC